mgnify:CR=1 FL=1
MVAWTWLMVFITLFIIAIIYIPASEVLQGKFFPTFQNVTNSEEVGTIINYFNSAWKWGIVIFIVGLFVWAILQAQKRVPETGYY